MPVTAPVLLLDLAVVAGLRAEVARQVGGGDRLRDALPLGHGAGDLAQDLADLALKVADTRLVGPAGDECLQGRVGQLDLGGAQAIRLELLGDKMGAGDADLLAGGVARQ